jgi:hypothetical protein
MNQSCGNVIFKYWWQFWIVVILQIITLICIPAAIQNIVAYLKR